MFGVISLLALALMAGACAEDEEDVGVSVGEPIERSPQTPIVIPADEPIVIGVSAALTGPTAGLGTESRDATILGVERWKATNGDQIAGHDIEVRTEDDGCFEADITEQAAERLLRIKGLVGVIGPMCSAGAEAAIPTYAEAGIVAISGSATSTSLTVDQPEGRFFFRTAYLNGLEGTFIGLFLTSSHELGI